MLMTTVISWNYFETVSGCFRAFPINYVTLNSTPGAGWGFRTEKKDFWAKSSVLAACRLSLSISWLEQSPICRIWTLKGRELRLLLKGDFRLMCFECDLHPLPALAEGLIDISEGGGRDQNRYSTDRSRKRNGIKNRHKHVLQSWQIHSPALFDRTAHGIKIDFDQTIEEEN